MTDGQSELCEQLMPVRSEEERLERALRKGIADILSAALVVQISAGELGQKGVAALAEDTRLQFGPRLPLHQNHHKP